MGIQMKIKSTPEVVASKTIYCSSEYSLTSKLEVDTCNDFLLVIADSFVFYFDTFSRMLVEFDSYTNSANWEEKDFVIPQAIGNGTLMISTIFESDRVDLGVVPEYVISTDKRHLKISFFRESHVSYFEIARGLFVGLHESHSLVDLIILDLKTV